MLRRSNGELSLLARFGNVSGVRTSGAMYSSSVDGGARLGPGVVGMRGIRETFASLGALGADLRRSQMIGPSKIATGHGRSSSSGVFATGHRRCPHARVRKAALHPPASFPAYAGLTGLRAASGGTPVEVVG